MAPAAPFGSWPSPITADHLVAQARSLGEIHVAGDMVLWNEGRPDEGGRQVLMGWTDAAGLVELLPRPWSARTMVHEYGGGAWAAARGANQLTLFFSNHADQRLYRLVPGHEPVAITPECGTPGAERFADLCLSPAGDRLACVRERHLASVGSDTAVINDLVVLSTDPGPALEVVASGRDFYAAPRFSPDGKRLAWLCWDHPQMPWDGTELWVSGRGRVAGGVDESVSQPRWDTDGALWWLSDRSQWWNLVREGRPVSSAQAELGGADWVFGQSTYAFVGSGRIAVAVTDQGCTTLRALDTGNGELTPISSGFTDLASLCRSGDALLAVAASPTQAPAVVEVDPLSGHAVTIRRSRPDLDDPRFVSVPAPVQFESSERRTAHTWYYPPTNPNWKGPAGQQPPLIVRCHGGPTAAFKPALDLAVQFFTTRGFAVADVNYGGSTGYGRAFRRQLDGRWGEVDVADCVHAARHLADVGLADRARLVVRGSSAGGLTALCALATTDVFAAGAIYYGVADLESLAVDTHKFESRYLDRLVGPWPAAREVYRRRSPVNMVDRITASVLILQGSDDRVVPPAQSKSLADALTTRGVPCTHIVYEGEGHGFRKAGTIRRAAEAELAFYREHLGL